MFRISGKEKYRERELKAPSQPRSRLRPRSATEVAVVFLGTLGGLAQRTVLS
jgi:hypothetical protein